MEEAIESLLLNVIRMFPRDNGQQPAVVNDLDQRQSASDLLTGCRERTLEVVQQEDMEVVVDLRLCPLLQLTILNRGPTFEKGEHAVDACTLLCTRELPF